MSCNRFGSSPRLLVISCSAALLMASHTAAAAESSQEQSPNQTSAPATAPAKAKPTTNLEAVTVVSRGETRQVQTISSVDLKQAVPGTSALKVLAELPGVQFQSSDPFGAYEWSTQITLHGFDQSRLGFTLDGIPLGNMSYSVTNGMQVTRAITTENIASVELAQGAGALGTASNSNLGGTIQYYSADPDEKMGVRVNQTVGSDSTNRTYVRFDTGDYHGFSMYVSYDDANTDKWKGYGAQKSEQANLKALYQWGDGNRISLFADQSDRHEHDYMDLSKTSAKVLGYNYDYLQPDWKTALAMAEAYQKTGAYSGVANGYPSSLAGLPANYDWLDANYYAGGGIRRDYLTGLNGQFTLSDNSSLQATIYDQTSKGEGQWVTPYVASPASGLPLSMRTTDYSLNRYGATAAWKYTAGINDIEVGVWLEQAENTTERNYFNLYGPYTSLWNFYSNEEPFARGFLQKYTMQTGMAYAQDTLHFLDDRLTVTLGNKALYANTKSTSLVPTTSYAQGQIAAHSGFLPQAGIDYKIDESQDIYASYSKNIDAYGMLPFSTSQAAFNASKATLRPESSQTFETGYRVHTGQIEASADLYYTHFANRLLSTSPCSAVETCAAVLDNVGSVKSKGADLALIWRPMRNLRWMNTVSYNSSKYEDNYLDDGVVDTRGKYVVGIPSWMYTSTLNLSFGRLSFDIDGKYTGKRYITYTNDSSVGGYWLFNAGVNYDFGRVIHDVEDISVGFNVYNLGNVRYFASTGTNGYVASDPHGYYQTLQAGAPRQFFFNVNVKL
ncbi:TonB-dependent receptor [Frateuria aurantia]